MTKQLTDAQKEARRKYQADRRAAGYCNSCSNKAVEGKTRCQKCLDRSAKLQAKTYQQRKQLGVCPQCKKAPASEGSVYCLKCLAYHKEKMDIRRQADDYKEQQKERSSKWYEEQKAKGMCPQCHERPAIPGKVHCDKCSQYHNDRAKERQAKTRNIVFGHYGTICACCKQDTPPEMLQIDHTDGGGRQHLKEIGQSRLYAWLIENNFPNGFATMCAGCNFAWGHNRCCPHAKDRLVEVTIDGKEVMQDPQTGKIAKH